MKQEIIIFSFKGSDRSDQFQRDFGIFSPLAGLLLMDHRNAINGFNLLRKRN